MSNPNLWLTIEPQRDQTRLMLSTTSSGVTLKACLPPLPTDPRALSLLLESLSAWYGGPLCAVLDADVSEVRNHPGRWALLLGDLSPHIDVEWVAAPVARPRRRRDGVDGVGDFRRARRLLQRAATGLT